MTSDMQRAFTGVDVVVMLAKLDRKATDDDSEYLKDIVGISRQHGAAINKYAKKTVKVVTGAICCLSGITRSSATAEMARVVPYKPYIANN